MTVDQFRPNTAIAFEREDPHHPDRSAVVYFYSLDEAREWLQTCLRGVERELTPEQEKQP